MVQVIPLLVLQQGPLGDAAGREALHRVVVREIGKPDLLEIVRALGAGGLPLAPPARPAATARSRCR